MNPASPSTMIWAKTSAKRQIRYHQQNIQEIDRCGRREIVRMGNRHSDRMSFHIFQEITVDIEIVLHRCSQVSHQAFPRQLVQNVCSNMAMSVQIRQPMYPTHYKGRILTEYLGHSILGPKYHTAHMRCTRNAHYPKI